ncbi:capsule polysaccharide export protein-like protein [Methylocella silvestris BL2]|uniref:Capsule polysaccharide export protein-like protein n=1 Tax=Methylocella silvestris (strain DSM 15510 / CIP 108128 / LMG 27833 / NCIMB 13906 / BL2) TaxID=395965 RepID=B8ERU5_METSB|nr:capsule polysaccharide transporter [Methylocella silvestris]ACK51643.1 capsule polysaccharide export protein-like protein [Methylocella silvestris BL2]
MSETHLERKPDDRHPAGTAEESAVEHFVLREDLRRVSVPIDQFGSWRWHQLSFAFCVLLPILLAGVYYGLVAADKYAAEFRFSIRTASDLVPDEDMVSMLLGKGGQNDMGRLPYMAASYLRSRNAVRDLGASISLRTMFSRPQADFLSRFDASGNDDRLWDYWQSMISINVDRVSGLVLVRVLAFTPDDAVAIAQALQKATERMIDDVAKRARKDALAMAEQEVERAGVRYAAALTGLRDVRNQEGTVDPQVTIDLAAKTLLGVVKEKLALERQRDANLIIVSSDAPQQRVLVEQIKALDAQILAQTEAMTSQNGEAKTAARTISLFEQQELERRFSQRLLEVALAAYEKAREEAERQHVYLAAFVPPQKPDIAEYPRRARSVAFVGVCAFGLWAVMMLLIAGVRDRMHLD